MVFLATHQLAFGGKIEVIAIEDEGGNGLFLGLFNYTLEKDQRLRAIIKYIRRNARYTTPICKMNLLRL